MPCHFAWTRESELYQSSRLVQTWKTKPDITQNSHTKFKSSLSRKQVGLFLFFSAELSSFSYVAIPPKYFH